MMHLTDDQLYNLAELSCEAEPLNSEEQEQLGHVQACRECFNKYCVIATILDATSLNCSLVLDPTQITERTPIPVRRFLAALRVTCDRMQNTISLIGKQIQQDTAAFVFEPVLATAVRGTSSGKTTVLHMEDLEDEDTFFVYDAEDHKLMLQFDAKGKEVGSFRTYLKFADRSTLDIPLEQKGGYLKGTLANVPEENFDVYIEEN